MCPLVDERDLVLLADACKELQISSQCISGPFLWKRTGLAGVGSGGKGSGQSRAAKGRAAEGQVAREPRAKRLSPLF